jgi:hypothetical protein
VVTKTGEEAAALRYYRIGVLAPELVRRSTPNGGLPLPSTHLHFYQQVRVTYKPPNFRPPRFSHTLHPHPHPHATKAQPHSYPHTTAYPTSTNTTLIMSTEATGEQQVIKITTSDNIDMKVDRQVAERSILIKNLLEDLGGDNEEAIPIPNVRLPAATILTSTR